LKALAGRHWVYSIKLQSQSDADVFYERDSGFELESGLEFLRVADELAQELGVPKVDFVGLKYMNPIVKHYAKKDFIYV
jgi:predicted nucleotidyltransferase